MNNSDPRNKIRPKQLRRISPYNGYNFGPKDAPTGFNASQAAIFYPKRNHPKYYYALTNMRNSVDFVKNQENFEYDFQKHLRETGTSDLADIVIREYHDETGKSRLNQKKVKFGKKPLTTSAQVQPEELDPPVLDGSKMIIPHAYNDSKVVQRKTYPVKDLTVNLKEQRTKARKDRKMRERDNGGWAPEWNKKKGDFKFWSTMTSQDWMKARGHDSEKNIVQDTKGSKKEDTFSQEPEGLGHDEEFQGFDSYEMDKNENEQEKDSLHSDDFHMPSPDSPKSLKGHNPQKLGRPVKKRQKPRGFKPVPREKYLGKNKQMQDFREINKKSSLVDFDKVKEPLDSGRVTGSSLTDFQRQLWKSDQKNYRYFF